MKNFLINFWQNEDGAETAEWIVIVALIVGVAVALYTTILQPQLSALIARIGTAITAI